MLHVCTLPACSARSAIKWVDVSASEALEIRIGWATTAKGVRQAQRVRHRVFCEEQGVSVEEELDGLDGEAMHLLALAGESADAVGTLRLLVIDDVAKLGRVAVLPRWRRRGIASRMVRLALRRARRCGCTEVRLASQLEVVGLYERFGFTVQSEPFEEAGIAHVWMGCAVVSPRGGRGIDPTPAPRSDHMHATPTEVQKALKGADYPADRESLIRLAEENDASDDVLEDLRNLEEEEEYESPAEVMSDLGEDE